MLHFFILHQRVFENIGRSASRRGKRIWEERDAPFAGSSPVLFVELAINNYVSI